MGVARKTVMFLFGAVAGCGLLADTIPTAKSKPLPAAQVQVELGVASLNRGDLNAAEAAFREGLRLQPDLIGALAGLADVAVRKGQSNEAESYLQKALKVAPQNPAVQRSWSRYLVSQRRYPEAEAALRKAIALAPKSAAVPQKELGDLYLLATNNPPAAVQAYRAAIALDPSVPDVHYGLGTALAALGRTDQAETELRQAHSRMPADPLPLHALGMLYAQRRDFPKAVQSLSEALEMQPQLIPTRMARAEAFEALGKDDQALADYSQCLRIDPRFAAANVKIGVMYQRQRRFAEAEKAYLAAISIDPTQAIAYNNLAFQAAETRTGLDKAVTWATKAVQLQPQASQFQDTLGWVRYARGELDEAARILEKTSGLKPPQPDVFYHLGVVYERQGRKPEAIAVLKKALALNPRFPESNDARKRLAQLQ